MRLAQGVDGVAIEIGDRFAHHFVGRAAIELHVAGHRQRVGAALLQGLADIERLDAGKFVDSLADQPGELHEQPPALGRGELSPFAGKRAFGRLDRGVDVRGLAARDLSDLNPARRVFQRQAFPRLRLDPAPADEALVGRRTRPDLRLCELVPASLSFPFVSLWTDYAFPQTSSAISTRRASLIH